MAHLRQQCHNTVTTLSQHCHNTVTTLSQQCHNTVTTMSQHCHNNVTTLSQHCHNTVTTMSQLKINDFFQEKLLKILKCYTFLWVQRRHNCSLAASFTDSVVILYVLKVHLQTFLSVPITQKCQILSCDILVANERYVQVLKGKHSH